MIDCHFFSGRSLLFVFVFPNVLPKQNMCDTFLTLFHTTRSAALNMTFLAVNIHIIGNFLSSSLRKMQESTCMHDDEIVAYGTSSDSDFSDLGDDYEDWSGDFTKRLNAARANYQQVGFRF